jgi:uncharacterized protein YndB with AHSA1/START domain
LSVPYLFPNYLFYYDEQNKSWQVNDTPEFPETTVTWELEEIDANKTRVELVHSGFTGKEERKLSSTEHDKGWSYFLDRLAKHCENTK